MILLIPGRHHLLTQFQSRYLFRFCHGGLGGALDTRGSTLEGPIEKVIFAVTSADHTSTRRNPLPFFLRAMAINDLGSALNVELLPYGIPEVGQIPDFASFTIKTIFHDSAGLLDLRPDNTIVVCATAVGSMYEALGFRVWDGEKSQQERLPWDLVERIAANPDWEHDPVLLENIHPSSWRVLARYRLGEKIRALFTDPLIGNDGDLTETRDYGTYVRQMDQNIGMKWDETREWVRPGKIGDIGCAVGSWLLRASSEPRLANSDFYGIEITRPLYDICIQRRHNGEFSTPNIWFDQRNAVEGQVFRPGSMTTIHSSSLTHEIESYGSRQSLLDFIRWRFTELESGGIWINRDVVGPEDGERRVVLELETHDGLNTAEVAEGTWDDRHRLAAWLESLSTAARFRVFAHDFRAGQSGAVAGFEVMEPRNDKERVVVRLRDAAEFLLTKDYTDNWQSEMHETFCHWAYSDWEHAILAAGFRVLPQSRAKTNEWIVENRWQGKVALYELDGQLCPWPPCGVLLLAVKP